MTSRYAAYRALLGFTCQAPVFALFYLSQGLDYRGLMTLTLAFAAYHSVTWFNLTPKALPVQLGEEFVPGWVIAGAHFAGWAALSFIILVLAL